MKNLEEAAFITSKLAYISVISQKIFKKGFIQGAQWQQANQWISVERNSDGVATKDCLEEMLSCLPILIYDKYYDSYRLLTDDN